MTDIDKVSFILGKKDSDYLQIQIDSYAYPNSDDFWGGNWLNTQVNIRAGAFTGSYKAQLRNVDFLDFKKGLDYIYNHNGSASFCCFDNCLQIKVKGNGNGRFTAECMANDNPGAQTHALDLSLNFNQKEIVNLITMIDLIIKTYPIKEIELLKQIRNR